MSDVIDDRFYILPFYIVCDVSGSMYGAGVEGLNAVLPVLQDAAALNPIIADVVQVGIISFNDSTRIERPLSALRQDDSLTLSAGGGTLFGPALRTIKSTIQSDVARLKAANYKVYRPAVFFLSDGGPNDSDWEAALRDLITFNPETLSGFAQYPVIVPMGLGGADAKVLNRMIHPKGRSKLYMVLNPKEDAARVIAEMATVMLRTIVSSFASVTAAAGGELHVFPNAKQLPAGIAVYEYEGGDEV